MTEHGRGSRAWAPWVVCLGLLGLYMTTRGYRSYEGDQAYRLPLLLHFQDPTLFGDDPFVRAFDAFNPHKVYLRLLAAVSRLIGLDATLFALWAGAFAAMAAGIGRLAQAGGSDSSAGLVAVGLVLLARAGNIGTNHLFEPIQLDRLLVMGLGWVALGLAVRQPLTRPWLPALLLGLGALIHPSLGALLVVLLGMTRVCWLIWPATGRLPLGATLGSLGWLGLAMAPALLVHGSARGVLFEGLPLEEFRSLSFRIQSPQHLLPGLWRPPQWLAWFCFPTLALIAMVHDPDRGLPGHSRLISLLAACLGSVGLAWVGVEVVGDARLTILQPFRLATIARGLCLAVVAGHLARLWRQGGAVARARVGLVAAGLGSDWAMVVATSIEATFLLSRDAARRPILPCLVLATGLAFLIRHDTERGYLPLSIGVGLGLIGGLARSHAWTPGRRARLLLAFWAVPLAALAIGLLPEDAAARAGGLGAKLVERCRLVRRPIDDVERLAVWCREHTPPSARFIGPPGPKSFRLWSERSVAFNRAASPYHAAGLADWAARFRAHVGFEGSNAQFARAYLRDRHGLEAGFGRLSPEALAELARSQGADHLLAGALPAGFEREWELIRADGRYRVYRLRDGSSVERSADPRGADAPRSPELTMAVSPRSRPRPR